MKNQIRCVLFDLDGTLLNTIGDLTAAVNTVLTGAGFPLHTEKEVMGFVGNGVEMIMRRACPPDVKEDEFRRLLSDFKAYYASHSEVLTKPYEGIPELLTALKKEGVSIGVASNKIDSVTKPLCRKYFGNLIDLSVGEREDLPKKPDPAMLLYLQKELGKTPEETVYIGDSDVDILVSKAAGLRCISCSWGFRTKDFLMNARKTISGDGSYKDICDTPEDIFSRICG